MTLFIIFSEYRTSVEFVKEQIIGYFNYRALEYFLGFKYACNEHMIAIVYLYAEIFLICFIIFCCVSDILFESIHRFAKYRTVVHVETDENGKEQQIFKRLIVKSNVYPRTYTAEFESTLELSFMVVPTLVVMYMLIPSLGFLYSHEFDITHCDTSLTVIITGHQWYWTYEYHFFNFAYLQFFDHLKGSSLYTICFDSVLILDEAERFDTLLRNAPEGENRLLTVDRRLVLPIDVPILLYTTSTDVIHSWTLPQFGIKLDAIPGRLSSDIISSFVPGVFCGQCSELCGVKHGFMPIVVEFVEFEIFLEFIFICLFIS